MTLDKFLGYHLFTFGGNSFSVKRGLTVFLMLFVFFLATRFLKSVWLGRVKALDPSRRGPLETLTRFAYYFILAIGIVSLLHINGVDLTTLTLLTSALGIGIGFGLQSITSNLISGIILLFERPIKVGDRIEVGEIAGDVIGISIRATTVLTNDNIAVIIPNSDFITQKITNWSFNDRSIRFKITIGVSYSADPETVRSVLLTVADNHPGVLKTPKPDVILDEFGDSSMKFLLRVWTQDYASRPGTLRSELNFQIADAFKKNGIEIPFPQRDLHIKSWNKSKEAAPAGDP